MTRVQGFCFFLLFSVLSWADAPDYFYKNKFPGSTCVPLSFYISTAIGSHENKSFWDGVAGANNEEKFENFLDECTRKYNPNYKLPQKSPLRLPATENEKVFFDFVEEWSDSPLTGTFTSFLPIFQTVQNNGMWLKDLLDIIKKMNAAYAEKLKLAYEEYSTAHQGGIPAYAQLYYLREKISRSLNNSFAPVITWDNLSRDSKLSNWTRDGGHAVTLTAIDTKVERGIYDSRLKFKYIDNEDGIEHEGYFYLNSDESASELEEINPLANNRIHVSINYLKSNRLFTLNGILFSKLAN